MKYCGVHNKVIENNVKITPGGETGDEVAVKVAAEETLFETLLDVMPRERLLTSGRNTVILKTILSQFSRSEEQT